MVSDRINGLAAILAAVRAGAGITQPLLVERVGLGRSVVAQRVAELEAAGLVEGAGFGPSSGGRAPRRLRLCAGRGVVLGIDVGATGLIVGVADLTGRMLASRQRAIDVAAGPKAVLSLAESLAAELLEPRRIPVWAVGVGVPGPVEFRTGLPIVPPIMPGWDRYPIRRRLRARFGAPVWVDNDVNLMALGELHAGGEPAGHMLYVRAGLGIGAAIVMDGRLYRGANGSAGDIGHVAIPEGGAIICRCGNIGCLEAVAGGAALVREGRLRSPRLAAIPGLRPHHVVEAAENGDTAARDLLHRTSALLGGTLATLVSFYNPNRLILGGSLAPARDHVLGAIREAIHKRALPLATRDLRIEVATLPEEVSGVTGTAHLALDEVFSPANLEIWLPAGSPDQVPQNVW
ncbi:putative ROK-family protein [Actinoplanes missouriensis 431]|uniref:Putative ROK-family protein n=1 Tax=Actinoplanes missouriensis (strain ATCC 14538 / DSM 43046 / CBS 188.64 / JCM 3121 / NBRC 102363 / NCIMB 12654 / NRRL B-3342 / UNCC 431) TaxID=512565 RepID=I0H8C0_ACTM4|nr:ROK family transcriptional regulator [Actinoplanes missouriensis]BAL89257.1 putative ROK-family protein [Actinoplanes missouriensis 431]